MWLETGSGSYINTDDVRMFSIENQNSKKVVRATFKSPSAEADIFNFNLWAEAKNKLDEIIREIEKEKIRCLI